MSNMYGCKEMGKLRSVSMRACYIGSGGHPDDGNPQICRIAANTGLTQRHKLACSYQLLNCQNIKTK